MAAETAIDALYKALSSPHPDPDLAHATVEEIRDLNGWIRLLWTPKFPDL